MTANVIATWLWTVDGVDLCMIYCKFMGKFEYEIKATNLLDTRAQSQSNAGNISVSATEYFIQPRFITFRVRYEL